MGLFNNFNKDEFLNKAKSTLDNATQVVKEKAGEAKDAVGERKSYSQADNAQADENAKKKSAEIINSILSYENDGSVFGDLSLEELKDFTKNFYDKLVFPASSVQLTKIHMFPFISQKMIDRFSRTVPMYNKEETALLHMKADGKQEFLLTEKAFYFVVNATGNDRYLSKGRIPVEQISNYTFKIGDNENASKVFCDEYELANFKTDKVIAEDFLSLNEYFRRIKARQFEITADEVDKMIRTKIGEKICTELKKYMIYDNEQFVYFAWGINSLTARDYIVCTTSQIIVMDREMFGATADVKQLYYEDITSATTEQNSKSDNLTGFLLDTAITAATKTCTLLISVAGNMLKINTLFKEEAERVVQVYHQYRKIGKQAVQPQVIVQQPAQPSSDDIIEQIKKLKELEEAGILTEEEFTEKKKDLLSKM